MNWVFRVLTGNLLDPGIEWQMPEPPFVVSAAQIDPASRVLLFSEEGNLLLFEGHLPQVQDLQTDMMSAQGRADWLRIAEADVNKKTVSVVLYSEGLSVSPEMLLQIPGGAFQMERIRSLLPGAFPAISPALIPLIFRGYHLFQWNLAERYCSRSGEALLWSDHELAKIGPYGSVFPRICPAVIVAVEREGQILLARSQRYVKGFFSLIAGFVEAGESLEDAVIREVREEVGLEVDDPLYIGSQSWPFPNALMLGFRARWKSGNIRIQEDEIAEAAWFSPNNLPNLPTSLSIAKAIIDFVCLEPRGEK